MGQYLNPDGEMFSQYKNARIFVDKSLLIKETNAAFRTRDAFMCVTRPRRFGKTLALSMLCAYYSKGCDSRELFKDLKISKDPSFEGHLNKHNVIAVDMAAVYTRTADKNAFIDKLRSDLLCDLGEAFPSVNLHGLLVEEAIIAISKELGERFVFLIDEWDVVFREEEGNAKLCDEYVSFLRSLFKSLDVSSCFDLVYMTGILPIKRYNTQSALNMFTEYNMLDPDGLSSYFGFTEVETKALCERYGRDFDEIKSWYDGYRLNGTDIYNPRSVSMAIKNGRCGDYWTSTSAIEAVTNYMDFDGGALKGAIGKMIGGAKVPLDPSAFQNDLTRVDSPDAALTVLVHLGYLGYIPGDGEEGKGSCYIPNREIRAQFVKGLAVVKWGEIYDIVMGSEELYRKTLEGKAAFIDRALDKNHKILASSFNKNKEDVLGMVTLISYGWMGKFYRVRKEEGSTLGRSDLSFVPKDAEHIPFIVELKVNAAPEKALEQIKSRRYWEAWDVDYKGKILLLGIGYDRKSLKHKSKVECIEIK